MESKPELLVADGMLVDVVVRSLFIISLLYLVTFYLFGCWCLFIERINILFRLVQVVKVIEVLATCGRENNSAL